MRKLGPLFLAALLVSVIPSVGAGSDTVVPPGFTRTSCASEGQGVEFTKMTRNTPVKAVAYVGRIAPGSPVRAKVVSSADRIAHSGEALEVPSTQCRRLSCILGVNADFHDVSTHEPLGGVVTEGRMLRSPDPARPQLTVTTAGQLLAGSLPWAGFIRTSDGRTVGLGAVNRPVDANGVVLFTRDWGTNTGTPSGTTELVLGAFGPAAQIGQSTAVDVLSKNGANSSIPADGVVLAGRGVGATLLTDLWNRVQAHTALPRAELRIDSAVSPFESVGGWPMLLRNGQNVYPTTSDSFVAGRDPRTFVGWNGTGEIFVAVVDGRTTTSAGMTLAEAADFMRKLGATDAINFDGGGGTTFVVHGNVANVPIDSGTVSKERGAINTLQILAATTPAPPVPPGGSGYWMLSADGTVYRFGDSRHHGDATPFLGSVEAVDLEPTPSGNGYWVVDSSGRVYAFGDAPPLGNVNPANLAAGERVTSLSATPAGGGYWIFTSRGRVFRFGNAQFFGDMSGIALNGPVLGSISTPSGQGYYMVASDGGIFAFGDAGFYGSMGGTRLNAPVKALVPDQDGIGYWLVAADGGVFAFEAPFRGSMGGVRLNRPISGMVAFGNGYMMVAEDGGIFNFSDRAFFGSLGNCPAASRIVSVAVLD